MPLHKTRPMVRKSCARTNSHASSGLISQTPSATDKSSQAAVMAQELASQASWADTYAPGTPSTSATPSESVADTTSQIGQDDQPPPSYEDVRRERELPALPQTPQENGFWRSDGTPIPPVPHRSYTRHETSTGITGTFTFYDELDLSTTSGTINIVIDPQPGDKVGVIRLSTRSGSIKVKFADEYMNKFQESGILDRTFNIEARSASGSQAIEVPQANGGTTSLTADSGSIVAKFFTTSMGKSPNATTVNTQTTSGSQVIKYKAQSSEPITSLAALHYAKGSANMKIFLPPVWQGMVHASSAGSGNVEVRGEDLQYQRNGNKEIYAWRLLRKDTKEVKTNGQVIEVIGDASGNIKVDCSGS